MSSLTNELTCILPLLPVIIGSGAGARSRATPYIVIASLGVSILVFTYLLKVSTIFITIPQSFWAYFSGGILLIIGFIFLFPGIWERVPGVGRLSIGGNKLVGAGHQKHSIWGDVMIGAALGPVFSSCSPTYFLILATVLPESWLVGTIYLLTYIIGLAVILLGIALLGQRFTARLTSLSDPQGWFKRGLGAIFILVGLLIMTGLDKQFEAWVLDSGFNIVQFENRLLEQAL